MAGPAVASSSAPAPASATAAAAASAAQQLPGLKRDQVDRAVASLLKHVADQRAKAASTQLFDEDEIIYLTIALKRSPHPGGPKKLKPVRIPIPHPLFKTEGAEVCLFVKDSKGGEGHKAAKARLAKFTSKGGVSKIIGLSKLRTKYESHEAKRQLCGSYDLFLADERVLPSLPKLIGKSFFKKRKQPIPIDIRAANFPEQVRRGRRAHPTHPSPTSQSDAAALAARALAA
jgi:ribosome biogenesis protein UTP30